MSAVKENVTIEVEFKNERGEILDKTLLDCDADLVEAEVNDYISRSAVLQDVADSITWKGRMTMNNEAMNGYRIGVIEKAISLPEMELKTLLNNIGEQLTTTELRKIAEGKYQAKVMGSKSKIMTELHNLIDTALDAEPEEVGAEEAMESRQVDAVENITETSTDDIMTGEAKQPISENMKTVDKL